MTKPDTVLFFVPLCSTWDRPNGKLLAARVRNNFKPIVEKGSISCQLRRHGADETMVKLGTVLFLVPLCSTRDRLNIELLTARGRNNCKLAVKKSSISW